MKDYLVDENDDLLIHNGDFVIGESLTQEVSLILRMNRGGLKEDPIMGASLIRLIKSNATKREINQIVRLQLERDGKNYDEIKNKIQIQTDELD